MMVVKKEGNKQTARLAGSATAGLLELSMFHPIDTLTKRLMSNGSKITSNAILNEIIFKDKAKENAMIKLRSLFPGLGYAAGYKILQRIYKYAGQPIVNDYLNKNHRKTFESAFGPGNGKAIMHAVAGSIIGIGEIILLPLDVLKIKRQTNPEAFRGRGIVQIVKQENLRLYRGWQWTAARNAPGSFALFGGNAFAKEYILGLKDYSSATFMQNLVTSLCGASASILVSAPLDVIKTRIQNKDFSSTETGFRIIKNMLKNEGIHAFFKGLIPKLLATGPKLVFSFAAAQTLIPAFERIL